MKKKMIVTTLLMALLITGFTFAATKQNPQDIFKSVTGVEATPGTRLMEKAEELGKGEAFFNAMQKSRIDYVNALVSEKVLTKEEGDFLISKIKENTYAEMQQMHAIQDKLRAAGVESPMGHGRHKGMGRGQGMGNCPYNQGPRK
ncbi:hypothetical protein [Guggenheimella bovis]